MDLLGSILNSMDKPPSVNEKERLRRKKAKEAMQLQQNKEKEKLKAFRDDAEKKINEFELDETKTKLPFPPSDRILRGIIHEIAQDAGMVSYSFGEEGIDRYIVVYKKEFVPSEDELNALRKGEEWNEEKARQIAEKRKREEEEEEEYTKKKRENDKFVPASNYQTKYQHLIGLESAKDAAKKTGINKQYGFVPSENKKDSRSIEQTLADIQKKKAKKPDSQDPSSESSSAQ
ncbi:sperm-associated antigen 7 homolog [Planococcus citri]|uniref:sperm-associated antigen 7 homolog n=1 Tax=Planococcus citri TaxID=170843 RepID=UPI0031F90798